MAAPPLLPTYYQQFIHQSRYARWIKSEGRRETWPETVDRYLDFMCDRLPVDPVTHEQLRGAILRCEVMPSMRAMMTAGPALARDNMCGYNCTYTAVDRPRKFAEILYILMCGTGVGFSCERQFINKLPAVPASIFQEWIESPDGSRDDELSAIHLDDVSLIGDSKEGWAEALEHLVNSIYERGVVPTFDFSGIRPAGERLVTMGGKASGPEPLRRLFDYVIKTFRESAGKRLTSLQVHNIVCNIGEIVVVGGVRRSALISLSNPSDDRMRNAKTGNWWENNPWLSMANNSAAYTEKPDPLLFGKEWMSLWESKSGERGIFNREASKKQVSRNGRRDPDHEWGTNPCSEIILRPDQCCNLSEVVIRAGDGLDELSEKVRLATILGTMQSSLTDFCFIGPEWKKNCEEERLLGVSLTGIMDNATMGNPKGARLWLARLKQIAISTNAEWAPKIGIAPSTAITCVKPSGTVSQLVDSASGIHPRYSTHYVRTVRIDKKDAMYAFLLDQGVPCEDEMMRPDSTAVFSFPVASPLDAVTRDAPASGAIPQLELWKIYQKEWCEHKPSITVNVRNDEWLEVGAWVWKHFDGISGVSFLPHDNGSYQQAPYQEISRERYERAVETMPSDIDWDRLAEFEIGDGAPSTSNVFACTGDKCELVDI